MIHGFKTVCSDLLASHIISHFLTLIYEIVTEKTCLQKLYARWLPKILTEIYRQKNSFSAFLQHFVKKESWLFEDKFVGDESRTEYQVKTTVSAMGTLIISKNKEV